MAARAATIRSQQSWSDHGGCTACLTWMPWELRKHGKTAHFELLAGDFLIFLFHIFGGLAYLFFFKISCCLQKWVGTWIRCRWRSTAGVAGILLVFHLQIAYIIPFPGLKDGCWWAHSPHHCENHMELDGSYEAQQQHTATFQARHRNSHCPRETGESSTGNPSKIHGWRPPWMESLVEASISKMQWF